MSVDELVRDFEERILPYLKRVVDETERFLYFIAWLNTIIEKMRLGRIIIVGGFAVEVLTGSTYRTYDIDIIVEGKKAKVFIEEFLMKISKPRKGRIFLPKFYALASKGIDIVGILYDKVKEPIKVKVEEVYVYIEACEELILTYLSGWKFWESLEDRDKVYALIKVYWNKIDREYVIKKSKEYNLYDLLIKVLRDLGYE